MAKKRIFISFAVPEDTRFRDFLVGQSKLGQSPFEFIDMSVKEPWAEAWRTNCRTKIKGCDGMIALLSKATDNSAGARWEMNCANQEGIPLLGMHVQGDNKGVVPAELRNKKVIEWSWPGLAAFIDTL